MVAYCRYKYRCIDNFLTYVLLPPSLPSFLPLFPSQSACLPLSSLFLTLSPPFVPTLPPCTPAQPVFTFPPAGAVVGTASQVFYNRAARNVLPAGGSGLKIKAGLNKWETTLVADLARASELTGGEW